MDEYTKMECYFSLEIAYEHCLNYQLISDVASTVGATAVASSGTVVWYGYQSDGDPVVMLSGHLLVNTV